MLREEMDYFKMRNFFKKAFKKDITLHYIMFQIPQI